MMSLTAAPHQPTDPPPCVAWRHAQRGVKFEHLSTRARATIAELGSRFIRNGAVVLLHGYSRVALAVLQRARQQVSDALGPPVHVAAAFAFVSALGCLSTVAFRSVR